MKRLITCLLALAGFATMTNPTDSQAADGYPVYVSVGGENRIAQYRLASSDGSLSAAGSVDVGGAVGSLGFSPDRRFLYAAVRDKESVATLRVSPDDGSLELVATTPVFANPVYVVVEHTGRFLLASSYGAGRAAVYRLGDDHVVQPQATQVVETEKNPHSILMDRGNRFVFVPNTGSHSVLQYRLDLDQGALVPNTPARLPTADGSGPRHFVFAPDNQHVYFVNETDSSVTACRLDEKGRLEIIQNLSTLPADFQGSNSCADIHITPDGRFLYASNRGHDSLAGYAVEEKSGRLTTLGQTPTEKTPREFEIDPAGRYLVAAGQGSGKLAVYRIDPKSGALQRLATHEVGQSPAWVAIGQAEAE